MVLPSEFHCSTLLSIPSAFSLASTTSLATAAIMGEPWMRLYSTIERMFSCARSPEYSFAIASKTSFLTRCCAEQIDARRRIESRRFMAARIQRPPNRGNQPLLFFSWYAAQERACFGHSQQPCHGEEQNSIDTKHHDRHRDRMQP